MKIKKNYHWFALTFWAVLQTVFVSMAQNTNDNNFGVSQYPIYEGTDLGLTYTPQSLTFKIWSPPAETVKLRFYEKDLGGEPIKEIEMKRSEAGTWQHSENRDMLGKYYTFQAKINGNWRSETPDPWAKTVGANGKRAHAVDLNTTNPAGWDRDKSPNFGKGNDAILYELHVRDASIHAQSGITQKGKFLGLTEKGTFVTEGGKKYATGLDHFKNLGITHVHLLPSFDYASVDETAAQPKYNWGYDPQNFNAPEGSYSTNPRDGAVRVREFKTLVKTFHDNGLNVVMDVVYNHVYKVDGFAFEELVPGYFFRQKADGSLSNASACGNETASERPMVRKFIIESVLYWVREYHVDGFRFDLMAIHDIETMNLIAKALRSVKPNILLYGEGWTAGDSPLAEKDRSLKKYAHRLDDIAVFSDDMRDGLKGSVFDHHDKGFVSGKEGMEESIKFGIVGALQHPQINYGKVNYSKEPYTKNPMQMINYAECHDNHTLWDRFSNANPQDTEGDKIKMFQLAYTLVLTAQGIPFIHAGGEFFRTKNNVENSFESNDEINQMDWTRRAKYDANVLFMQKLIALRKHHPAFSMKTAEAVAKNLHFLDITAKNLIVYQIKDNANGDKWKDILLIFNANRTETTINLPEGKWKIALQGNQINERGIKTVKERVVVAPLSAMILFRK